MRPRAAPRVPSPPCAGRVGYVGRRAWVAAWAVLFGCGGGDDALDQPWLEAVDGPAVLVTGSPLSAQGRGLAGGVLLLRTAAGVGWARVRPAIWGATATGDASGTCSDGGGSALGAAQGFIAEVVQVAPPGVVRQVCVATDATTLAPLACIDIANGAGRSSAAGLAFGPLPALSAPTLQSAVPKAGGDDGALEVVLGEPLALRAQGLLLPGEGDVWLELEPRGGEVPLAAGATVAVSDVAWSRDGAVVRSDAAGLGAVPGGRSFVMRVARRLAGGDAIEHGPWSTEVAMSVAPPSVTWSSAASDPLVVRRGRATAISWPTKGCPDGAQLELVGTWATNFGPVTWPAAQPRSLPFRALADGSCRAALPSTTFALDGWGELPIEAEFQGEAALRVASWRGGSAPIRLVLRPSSQVVELQFEPGVTLGLHRFGLAMAADAIEARVRALVHSHFEGLAVAWVEQAGPDVVDTLRVRVLGDDPNGLGLLGTEPSHGKDDGNRVWTETIGGFCAEAWLAGVPAWGGIFVSSFLRFSPTLTLGGGGDPRFDAIFGPFAPELGGSPVHDAVGLAAAAPAIEALSQLLSGTISHEIGHALGLAAGTTEFHHTSDHPGWRMDAGPARPFAERAALPDATPEDWGEVDLLYLQTSL